jgi:hypothetical protein
MRSGRPAAGVASPRGLPPGYNRAARRWVAFMVSTPIVIVTSWLLYERRELIPSYLKAPANCVVVLGKEQRPWPFLPPGAAADAPGRAVPGDKDVEDSK